MTAAGTSELESSVILQEQIQGFIRDIFDFDAADYSSVSGLAESIMRLARQRRHALYAQLQDLETSVAESASLSWEGEPAGSDLAGTWGTLAASHLSAVEFHASPRKGVTRSRGHKGVAYLSNFAGPIGPSLEEIVSLTAARESNRWLTRNAVTA